MTPIYLFDYMDKPLSDLCNALLANPKQPLDSLRLFDLLIDEETGHELRHGVYMFFDVSPSAHSFTSVDAEGLNRSMGGCLYVGKCDTSHFAGRIGLHFGLTPLSKFNTFLRRCVDRLFSSEDYLEHKHFYEGVRHLKNHKLLLLPSKGLSPKLVKHIETLMFEIFKPEHNRIAKKRMKKDMAGQMNQTLGEVLRKRCPELLQ